MATGQGIIQRSFAGGIIDPALVARGDTNKNASGLRTCRNWQIARTGVLQNRAGWGYVATAKDSHDDIRLAKFAFNDAQTYVLEFGTGYVRFFQDGARLLTGSQSDWADATAYVPGDIVVDGAAGGSSGDYFYCVATHTSSDGDNGPHDSDSTGTETDILTQFWYGPLTLESPSAILELPTPYAQADLGDLDFAQSGDVVTVTHRDHPPHELVRTSNTAWTCLPVAFKPQAKAPYDLESPSSGATAGSRNVRYMVTAVMADSETESLPAPNKTTVSGRALDNQTSTTLPLKVTGSSHGLETGDPVYIVGAPSDTPLTQANENALIALQDCVFTITDDVDIPGDDFTLDQSTGILTSPALAVTFPDVEVEYAPAYLEFDSIKVPGTGSGNVTLLWQAPADGSEVQEYRVYRSVDKGPYGLIKVVHDTTMVDGEVDYEADLTLTPQLYGNPFRYGSWPRVVGYYQQRVVYAGSNDYPQRVWMSVSADFRNFARHDPVQDNDRVIWTISGTQANEIVGLADLGQLIVFTNGAIWTAVGDQDETITPTAINPRALSYEGATDLQPALMTDAVIYAQARGSQVRELRFNLADGGSSGFLGRNLTVFAAHLFDGYTMVDWDDAEAPEPILWAVRSDGTVLGLTYLTEHDIWAWHEHTTGASGEALSIVVVPEGQRDAPYCLIKRTVDGADAYYIERMAARQVGYPGVDPRVGSLFMDSFLTYDGTNTSATTLTLTGGSTWNIGETGLTLTASVATFPGDSSNVGNGYRLVATADDGTMYEVEVEVTGDASTTVQTVTTLAARTVSEDYATFTAVTSVPTQTRATALSAWVAMVDDLSGLGHIEGETVAILADGNVLAQQTVTSGALTTLARPYGVIHVGLPISAQAQTVDIDQVNTPDAVLDLQKIVVGANVAAKNTRALKLGYTASGASTIDGLSGSANTYLTGKYRGRMSTDWNNHGRLWLVQDDPVPAEVDAIITHVTIKDREP